MISCRVLEDMIILPLDVNALSELKFAPSMYDEMIVARTFQEAHELRKTTRD